MNYFHSGMYPWRCFDINGGIFQAIYFILTSQTSRKLWNVSPSTKETKYNRNAASKPNLDSNSTLDGVQIWYSNMEYSIVPNDFESTISVGTVAKLDKMKTLG